MTRDEHLAFCKRCVNREMNTQTGLVCALTQRQADFQDECADFKEDESVVAVASQETLESGDIALKVTPEVMQKLRAEQNFPLAVIAGVLTGLIGAVLWAAITVSTEYQIGYMALAIGFGVGFAIRIAGKGIDPIYGFLGATIALLSCVLGNVFGIVGFVANSEGLGYVETLVGIDYSLMPEVMAENFSVMDILFYGIAIFEGYKFSFRRMTEEELHKYSA